MQLAIDTFSYHMRLGKHGYKPRNPSDIRWYCHKSKQLYMDGLHIDPYHIDIKKDAGWVSEFALENNMYIELGACGTSLTELGPYILAAAEMKAEILRTFAGGSFLDGRAATAKRTEAIKKELEASVEMAASHGIMLALENHGDLFIDDLAELMSISGDNLGICFDSGNFAFTGEDPLHAIDILGDRVVCTHLKDVCAVLKYSDAKPFASIDGEFHFCALGEGRLPLKNIIDRLMSKNAGLRLTLEICSPERKNMNEDMLLAFEEDNVKKSIWFIKQLYPRKEH
ncbi:MAG: sugar phosphate isomerase/epimerase [Clostridia bacterium]